VALVSLLTAAVALTWLVTEVFIRLGLAPVTIAIALILTSLLAALIRLISSTALTLSAICICQWCYSLVGLVPLVSVFEHPRTPLMSCSGRNSTRRAAEQARTTRT